MTSAALGDKAIAMVGDTFFLLLDIASTARLSRSHKFARERTMSRPLVVMIPHHLGKPEAIRRLKSGLAGVRENLPRLVAVQEEVWTDGLLQFRVGALGQVARGTIDVQDDHVRLEVMLPWLLALLADKIQPAIRAQGTLMLEKK
jgi:hypothetical protein